MQYIIDTKSTPPVVVLQFRDVEGAAIAAHLAVAQRYADQTGHVLVVTSGPDAVTAPLAEGVVHPTAHAPEPQQPLPVQGLNLAPVTPVHHGAVAADISAVWDLLKSLEPLALDTLFKLLGALVKK